MANNSAILLSNCRRRNTCGPGERSDTKLAITTPQSGAFQDSDKWSKIVPQTTKSVRLTNKNQNRQKQKSLPGKLKPSPSALLGMAAQITALSVLYPCTRFSQLVTWCENELGLT
eukprot:scpid8794/ scgid9222/ 